MTSFAAVRRRFRQVVLGHRHLLAAALATVAVAAGISAARQPPVPTTPVLTAARDLPSGTRVTAGDLVAVPFVQVPAGVLSRAELVGRTTAAPVRAGEPLTDVRLVAGSLLRGYPGTVAAPVRIGDGDVARLLRVGDRVDLLAATPDAASATLLAPSAPILAVPAPESANSSVADATEGALVIVALPEETARTVAAAGVSTFISVVIKR